MLFRSALAQATTMERTAELARRLFRRSQAGTRVDAARIVVLNGPATGKRLDIPKPVSRALVGRNETCQLVLPDAEVSREHAELVHDLDGVLIRNLDSQNTLEINGQVVAQRREEVALPAADVQQPSRRVADPDARCDHAAAVLLGRVVAHHVRVLGPVRFPVVRRGRTVV